LSASSDGLQNHHPKRNRAPAWALAPADAAMRGHRSPSERRQELQRNAVHAGGDRSTCLHVTGAAC